MVTCKVGKHHAGVGIDALKELFLISLLPDRKLKCFGQQSLHVLSETKDANSLLLFWYWEVKNEILIGRGLDAKKIGSNMFQLQCQELQKYSALKESSSEAIEIGFCPNNKSVEREQIPNSTPSKKSLRRKSKQHVNYT